jgi:hypothetical protein
VLNRLLTPYARLSCAVRGIGRSIRAPYRAFGELLNYLRVQWPVSLVLLGLALCFMIPGLAAQQTAEALLEYVGAPKVSAILWSRTALTALAAVYLGSLLRYWSCRLLDSKHLSSAGLRSSAIPFAIAGLSGWFPVLSLAWAFLSLPGSAGPYRLIAVGLVAARPACRLAILRLKKWTLGRSGGLQRRTAFQSPIFASLTMTTFLVAVFGTGVKDRVAGIPLDTIALARFVGPVVLLLVFFATFVSIASMMVLAGRSLRLPLVFLTVLAACVFAGLDINDNHPVRTSTDLVDDHPADVQTAFDSWLEKRPDRSRFSSDYPVLLVSAEGGGIRAAFFTAVTLARVVDRCPPLAHHIFAISGVSGGAVGAAVFAAALKAMPPSRTDRRCDLTASFPPVYEDAVAAVLQDDHLSPLLARLLFPDALQQILPFPVFAFDRQLGLEFSLEQSFRRVFGKDLLSGSIYALQPSETEPAVPYLLLNSTEVDGGRRFVMTPLYLRTEEFNGVEDWHWLDWIHGPPISVAAATSARFPVFSPAGYAYNNRRKTRYVDGGYADNSGSVTIAELYDALYRLREQKYLGKSSDGSISTKFSMAAIHIGNAPICNLSDPAMKCEDIDATPPLAGGLGEVLSPVRTVLSVRSAQVEYNLRRLDTTIEMATDFNRFDFHDRIQMYDRDIPVPLGWLLSHRVATELRSQLDFRSKKPDCSSYHEITASNYCVLKSFNAFMTWADN